MIDWGDLPAGSHATIHIPGIDANEILRLAAMKFRGGCEPGNGDSNWWCPTCETAFAGPDNRWAINQAIQPANGTLPSSVAHSIRSRGHQT